ncbi:hypothetical protein JY651_50280 [Pyxidicoccus parkwayensis]|jgi:hypothetical protein|uniref:Uncharacterized protein n=1 Tax=Pyxidicoccus parkwayensis TaxID=2813578 RepID=A0ABX7P2A2_9BACT|nr:hypothetical protein [Pyxidicoccus parkwaysis]QSQ23183.1 hypothetical protein JY651_50280 [Pyxidicoccus parkwaysis]
MDRPLPVLPPHPTLYLADAGALASYLRAQGRRHRVRQDRVVISLGVGEFSDATLDVFWLDDQVRFNVIAALDISSADLAQVALAAERVNEEIGFPVWRVLPMLSATYTVTLDHEGRLSSRVLEYAIALLRDALVRDQPVFRAQPGVVPP